MSLLRVRDVTKQFITRGQGGLLAPKVPFTAVDRVSFDIELGETLAIVGESGSGKSTTARIAARLLDPTSGTLEFEEQDITRATGKQLARFRNDVQVVFQDPFSSLNPRYTVERIVTAPLAYQGISPKGGVRAFSKELMERVGLNPDHSARYPSQFSGGQAQRIGIARALAVGPKLVICDEAVSALDVSIQAQILDLLVRLQRESGFSYIFIAHDLAVVRQIAGRVAVMNQGRIVELGSRDQVFDQPQDEYTKTLLAAVPRINPEWDRRRRLRQQERMQSR